MLFNWVPQHTCVLRSAGNALALDGSKIVSSTPRPIYLPVGIKAGLGGAKKSCAAGNWTSDVKTAVLLTIAVWTAAFNKQWHWNQDGNDVPWFRESVPLAILASWGQGRAGSVPFSRQRLLWTKITRCSFIISTDKVIQMLIGSGRGAKQRLADQTGAITVKRPGSPWRRIQRRCLVTPPFSHRFSNLSHSLSLYLEFLPSKSLIFCWLYSSPKVASRWITPLRVCERPPSSALGPGFAIPTEVTRDFFSSLEISWTPQKRGSHRYPLNSPSTNNSSIYQSFFHSPFPFPATDISRICRLGIKKNFLHLCSTWRHRLVLALWPLLADHQQNTSRQMPWYTGKLKQVLDLKKRDQWCNTKDANYYKRGRRTCYQNWLCLWLIFIDLQTYLWYQEKVNSYMWWQATSWRKQVIIISIII